jgi:hypothetical protein
MKTSVVRGASLALCVMLALFLIAANLPLIKESALPDDVSEALNNTASVTLYLLQSEKTATGQGQFYQRVILGHIDLNGSNSAIARAEFQKAATTTRALLWEQHVTPAICCTDRHAYALSFRSSGDAYDLLLCYECGYLEIYRDARKIAVVSSITGTSRELDEVLMENNVHASKVQGNVQ